MGPDAEPHGPDDLAGAVPGAFAAEMDPAVTNPDSYRVIFGNDRVRVLEYRDLPGHRTTRHSHPDSVMYTLSSFRRRLMGDGRQVDVDLPAGAVRWLGAQVHAGENIGDTDTHTIFIELLEPRPPAAASRAAGGATALGAGVVAPIPRRRHAPGADSRTSRFSRYDSPPASSAVVALTSSSW